MSGLTTRELAWQAGTTADEIDRLAALGILATDEKGLFPPKALHRVRLALAMRHAGVTLDDIGKLVAEKSYTFDYVDDVFPHAAPPLLDKTYADVAAEAGLPMETVEQLYTNWSLPPPDPDARIRADDADMLRGRGRLHTEFGLDYDAVVASSRFFGEALRRLAEGQVRVFRERVVDRLRASGMSTAEMLEAVGPIAASMRPGADELRARLYERHFEDYVFQQSVEIFENAMDEAGYHRPRPLTPPAIAFLDIGGYTLLTQKAGDEAAAELAARLVALVRRSSRDHGGEAVKLLGDGVMFHFPRPEAAVACGLELIEAAEGAGLPPARIGADVGPVVFRDGDYFGQTVNVAARITDYARPREVLVSGSVVDETRDGDFEFESIGAIPLKGVREPVLLYRVLNRNSSARS